MDLVTHFVAFLIGAFTGAAGKYLADRFTDTRRRQEAKRAEKATFADAKKKVGDLITEIQKDLTNDPNIREFFIVREGNELGGSSTPRFFYSDTEANQYANKAHVLENYGYIECIKSGLAPIYRMSERFVDLVLSRNCPSETNKSS